MKNPVSLLPASLRTCAADSVGGSPARLDEEIGVRVIHAWRDAQAGLCAIVQFGALLIEVEAWLKKRGGFNGLQKKLGVGLKAWLSANAPEVDYKTAMGYKYAASGLRALADKARDRPLLLLMGEAPLTTEEENAAREQVREIVATSSLRLLKAAAKAAGPARDPSDRNQGRHPKNAEKQMEEAVALASDPELADGEMGELLGPLSAWALERDGVATLSDEGLGLLLETIDAILKRAKAVREERRARTGWRDSK